jgi:hypothetical protein
MLDPNWPNYYYLLLLSAVKISSSFKVFKMEYSYSNDSKAILIRMTEVVAIFFDLVGSSFMNRSGNTKYSHRRNKFLILSEFKKPKGAPGSIL